MRGNPFRVAQGNPMQRLMDLANRASQISKNPGSIADVLYERGAIDQNTHQALHGKSPSQIGQYLMQNGMIRPQDAQNAYQNAVPNIQRYMN